MLRGILSGVGSTFNNLGIFFLSLGESFAIRETKPLINILLNRVYFGDEINPLDIGFGVSAIFGVLMILQP